MVGLSDANRGERHAGVTMQKRTPSPCRAVALECCGLNGGCGFRSFK